MKLKVCNRCVMDSSAPEIEFDESGICNFCKDYDIKAQTEVFYQENGEKKFHQLMEKIRNTGKKYDVLIGLSGGVDSSYVAYLLKRYNVRVLAVHVDNGWNTELSVANVEEIVKRLNIDLVTNVLDWNEFKDIQKSFIKSSISNIEIPTDHAIWATLVKTASQFGIKYIISGSNVVTEAIMPNSWLYGSKDSKLILSIQKRFGSVKIKTYPFLTTWDYIKYLLIKRIKWVPVLNYIPFNKELAKEILIKELGWRDYGGKHYENIFTRFFHAFYLPEKFGYDLRKAYLSASICSGQISREEALLELKAKPASEKILREDVAYVRKKLGISESEFETYLRQKNKTHLEYKNNEHLWSKLASLVKIARDRITRI